MNFIDLATIATFLISLVITMILVVVVYKHNPKNASNRIFVGLGLVIIVWSMVLELSFLRDVLLPTIWWIRLGISLAVLQTTLILLFTVTIPKVKIPINRKWLLAGTVITAGLMMLMASPYSFSKIIDYQNNFPNPQPGWALIVFNVYVILVLITAVVLLIKKYRKSSGHEKRQYFLVLFGITAMHFLLIFSVSLPILLFRYTFFIRFHFIYTLILLFAFAFAITRYRLFDIRVAIQGWLIKGIIIVAVAALGLAAIYTTTYFTSQLTNQTAILYSLILGVIIMCAGLIHYILTHYFTRSSYDLSVPAELTLVEDANATLQQLRRTVSKILQDQYGYETILFFLYDWREKRYRTYQDNKIKTMPENHSIITVMNVGPMVLTRDSIIANKTMAAATRTEILSYMRRHQADSIIPLYTELFISGIVVIKHSEAGFAEHVPERELLEFGKLYGHYMERILTFDALISKQPEA